MEIERKYLLSPEQAHMLEKYSSQEIEQSYISAYPVIRLRKIIGGAYGDGEYVLTAKGSGAIIREEFEIAIDGEQYDRLLSKIEGNVIKKTRYIIPLPDGHTAEADVYQGYLSGLMTVEVEFADEDDMNSFAPPEWFGRDVSEEREYKNVALAMWGHSFVFRPLTD